MHRLRYLGTALLAMFAIAAIAATAASAKPEFLDNVKGNKFTAKSGAGELARLSGVTVNCGEDSAEGEITGNETGIITKLDFKKCKALGFATANSLGDASETILADKLPFELCYIKETAPVEVGIHIKDINSHIEVPLGGVLINITGSIIAKVDPINKLQTTGTLTLKQTKGDPAWTKCTLLGKVKEALLLSSKDEKHVQNEDSGISNTANITFEKDVQIDA